VELALTADAGTSATVEHILKHSSKPKEPFACAANWQTFSPAVSRFTSRSG
jgi:hypothetical protein